MAIHQIKRKKAEPQPKCHPLCLRSDPRRVILCQCNCRGTRHGQGWIAEHGADEIRTYYSKLQARWDHWERASLKLTAKVASMSRRRAVG